MKVRKNNPSMQQLMAVWSKHYPPLSDTEMEWIRRYAAVHKLRKGDILYTQGDRDKNVFIVIKGLLGRCEYEEVNNQIKRSILNLAMPIMALSTTEHLLSKTPSVGHIVVLRANTRVIEIPYRALQGRHEREPAITTLINVLMTKKREQLRHLRYITRPTKPYLRYGLFAEKMPLLEKSILTNQERADLLGISIDSVYRARRIGLRRE